MGTQAPIHDLLGSAQYTDLLATLATAPTVVLLGVTSELVEPLIPTITQALLPTASARANDLRLASPDALNWTVGEVESQIIAPSTLTPTVRNVIVVTATDRMSAACADHLLKAIEEPLAPTTFVLCAPDPSRLPATIRGRATATVALTIDLANVKSTLIDASQSAELVDTAALVLGPDLAAFAALGTSEPALLTQVFETLIALPAPSSAATTAAELANLLTRLCDAATESSSEESSSVLSRRRARSLAALCLAAWRRHVITLLATRPDLSTRAAVRLTAFTRAEDILGLNGPLDLALASALSV